MSYVGFNFKRVVADRKNFLLIVLALIVISFFYYTHHNSAQHHLLTINSDIENSMRIKQNVTNEMSKLEQNSDEYNVSEKRLEFIDFRLDNLMKVAKAFKNNRPIEAYDNSLALIKTDLELVENQPQNYSQDFQVALQTDYDFYTYLKQNKITYDDYHTPVTGIPFLYYAWQNLFPLIISSVLVILLTIIYSSYIKERINVLNLLPPSALRYYGLNIVFGVLLGLIVFVLLSLILFVVIGLIKSFGPVDFPLSFYHGDKIVFKSLSEIVIPSGIMLLLGLITLSHTTLFLSMNLKRKMTVALTGLVLLVGLQLVSRFLYPLAQVSPYLPSTYFDVIGVLTHRQAFLLGQNNIQFDLSIIVLVVFNVLLFGLNWLLINKRGNVK